MPVRIIFKTDAESGVNRGAITYRQHFEPRMAKLLEGMARAVEEKLPAAKVLRVTEGYRPQRVAGQRDRHTDLCAFDFTIEFIQAIRATEDEYKRVAEHCRKLVGDADYDFLVHGEGAGLHIHAEYDPHPQTGVA